ncbi:MAG: hypothetical protein ACP5HU_02625 [Phycisphaerae bacterium]
MRSRFRRGSARLVAALFGGAGLIGLLIAIAIMSNMAAEQADTSLRTREKAEEDIEQIQEQLDIQGQRAEEIMDEMDGRRPGREDTTTAPEKEDNNR